VIAGDNVLGAMNLCLRHQTLELEAHRFFIIDHEHAAMTTFRFNRAWRVSRNLLSPSRRHAPSSRRLLRLFSCIAAASMCPVMCSSRAAPPPLPAAIAIGVRHLRRAFIVLAAIYTDRSSLPRPESIDGGLPPCCFETPRRTRYPMPEAALPFVV